MKIAVECKPIGKVCIINPKFDRNGLTDDDAVSFVPMSALDEQSGRITLREEGLIRDLIKGYTPFSENDVLFAKITPCMENGKVAIARSLKNFKGFGSTEFHVFRPCKEVIAEWIFYCLRNPLFRKYAEANMTGSAGQKRVPVHFFDRAGIPVPPLSEQKRVVSLLVHIESALEKRRQTLALADDFLKSAFLEMFSFYLYGQKQCDKQPIGKVTHFIDYRGKTPRKAESGTPLITAKNVKKGFISDEPREYILEDDYNSWMTRGFPKEGDVLFTTEAPLGNAAILGKLDKVVVGQRIITIQSGKTLKSEYLLYCLLSSVIQSEISKRSTGSTARGIRSKEFEKILIPIPSIDLQNKFADLVHKVEKLKGKQKQSETQLQNLFNSLMQRAFKGELFNG